MISIRISILYLLSLAQFSNATINLRYIKDTYSILKPEFRQLSPAHGPIWWERDIVRNMYTYGLYGKNPGNRKQDGISYPKMPYATIQLTRLLFHVVQGSFNATMATGSIGTYLTPHAIGRILGTIERSRAEIMKLMIVQEKNQKALVVLKEIGFRNLSPEQKKVMQVLQKGNKELSQKINKIQTNLAKELTVLLDSDQSITNAIRQTKEKIIAENDEKELRNFTRLSKNKRSFVAALVGSLQESGFFSVEGNIPIKGKMYYPPYTPYFIMLTFLYRKAENIQNEVDVGKKDFKAFFEGVQKELEEYPLFTGEGTQTFESKNWLMDAFDDSLQAINNYKETIEQAVLEVAREFEIPKIIVNAIERIENSALYEMSVFMALSYSSVESVETDFASYRVSNFKGVRFPDCTDTTIRNLANLILFDGSKNQFNIDKINTEVPEQTKMFYTNDIFKKVSEIENPRTHDAWNELIQNRPYIAYERIVSLDETGIVTSIAWQGKKNLQGFIRETPFLKKQVVGETSITFTNKETRTFNYIEVNERKFILVDPNQYAAYEIEPSLKNVIILFNDLFNLQLFADIKNEFMVPNFNKKYFPQLAKNFGWQYETKNDLDADDYKKLKISLAGNNIEFDLRLSWNHGEVVLTKDTTSFPSWAQDIDKKAADTITIYAGQKKLYEHPSLINIFSLFYEREYYGLQGEALFDLGIQYFQMFLFYLKNVQHPSQIKVIAHSLLNTIGLIAEDLVATMIEKFPIGADAAPLKALGKALKKAKINEIIRGGNGIKLTQAAGQLMKNAFNSFGIEAVNLVELFPWAEFDLDYLMELVPQIIDAEDQLMRDQIFVLFGVLLPKKRAYQEAIQVAMNNLGNHNRFDAKKGMTLVDTLINKKETVNDMAEALFKLYDELGVTAKVQERALEYIWVILDKKNPDQRIFQQALAYAQKAIRTANEDIKGFGYFILMELVKKDIGLELAQKIAKEGLEYGNDSEKELAQELKELLQKEGKWQGQ